MLNTHARDVHTHVVPFSRREWQKEASSLTIQTRFFAGCAARGLGKTALLADKCGRFINRHHDRTLIMVYPTFGMGLRSWWPAMMKLYGGMPGLHANKGEYFFENTFTNSRVWLVSFDTPERARGLHGDILMDEAQAASAEDTQAVVWPMVHNAYKADPTTGRFEIWGTADDSDNMLKTAIEWAREGKPDWSHKVWDVYEANVWTQDYIDEVIRPGMSDEQFRREYLCEFNIDRTNLVFNSFGDHNLRTGLDPRPKEAIEVGMDFNVMPMTATLNLTTNYGLHQFDEIYIENSNTEEVCEEIRSRYPGHPVIVSPDQSGRNRSTSSKISMQSDHAIIRSYGYRVRRRAGGNPPVLPSVREVNMMLKDAAGNVSFTIDPRCERTIKGFKTTRFKPGTSLIDKSNINHHIMDAVRYVIHFHSRFAGRTTATVQDMVF